MDIMKTETPKSYIIERRNEIILQLHIEGYTCGDISAMINIDRTWIYRIIKRSKHKKKSE